MRKKSGGFRRFWSRQEGQGMTEYGLIIALIAVVLITTLNSLSGGLKTTFTKVTTQITNANKAK